MSRATDLAYAEAEAAEAENPDEETVEPIEPDEPDEEEQADEEEPPAEPSSLATVQEIDKALTAEQKRHAKALAKALGPQWADFEQCPLCQVDGYAMAYGAGEIGPEQRAAILAVMGDADVPDYKDHPTEGRCDTCDGWGEMTNGSRREGQGLSACPDCFGTGHKGKVVPQPNVFTLPQTAEQGAWQPPPPPSAPNVDTWGRPMGHPDWGLDPASVVSVRQ